MSQLFFRIPLLWPIPWQKMWHLTSSGTRKKYGNVWKNQAKFSFVVQLLAGYIYVYVAVIDLINFGLRQCV
jgi:hypothetical protein